MHRLYSRKSGPSNQGRGSSAGRAVVLKRRKEGSSRGKRERKRGREGEREFARKRERERDGGPALLATQ